MSAIKIVLAKLLASPEITDIVGDKIFPIQAPQLTSRPYIILHIIDLSDQPVLAGASHYFLGIVQVDYYAEMTPEGAMQVLNLGDAGIAVLNGVVKERFAGCTDIDVLLGSADYTDGGFLEAQTHRRYTQFKVRYRVQPGAPAEPAVGNIVFTVTAAAGNDAVGYAGAVHYAGWGPFGSISAEPIAGYPLQGVTRQTSTGSVIAFTGDVTALLVGKSVWVDGVDYGPGVQYAWDYAAGVTIWSRITGGPVFVDGVSYNIEIK